jgi:PAS domain S-box-containing protein
MKKDIKSYRILIIESSGKVLLSLKKLLLKRIVDPIIVNSVDFKSAEMLMSHEDFDIILLDLNLSDIKGKELLYAFGKENFSKTILLTELEDATLTRYAISKGVSDYLIKSELSSRLLYKSIVYAIERRKNIAKLEESEKRYSDLFYLNPQPMYLFDFETLNFLRVNDAMLRQYEYSIEEFLSMSLLDIRPDGEIDSFKKVYKHFEHHDKLVTTTEFKHKRKNGDTFYVEISCNVIYMEGRKCGLATAVDVTERLNYLKTIEERNQRLQDIAFTQSHIVRAPLANMMGILYLIRDFDLNSEEGEELLQHFITCGLELDKNIKDIVLKSNFFEAK